MSNPEELTEEERAILLHGSVDEEPACDDAPRADECSGSELAIDRPVNEAITSIYRDFAMRLASQLTERLRCETQITDLTIEQPSYGEFIFSMQHPTCLHVVHEPSCQSSWLIELNPKVVFPMLDRLLGGGKLPATTVRRPLTEIETRLVSRIMEDILSDLVAAWRPTKIFKPILDRIEGNPKLVRESPPGEILVTANYEIAFDNYHGPLRIAMTLADVMAHRSAILDPQGPPADQVTMSISLAESIVPESDLQSLAVGDIIATDADPDQLATIYIDGEPKFLGVPGTSRGKKAIRIEKAI